MGTARATIVLAMLLPVTGIAGIPSVELPIERMRSTDPGPKPVSNAAFAPGAGARAAPEFSGTLSIGAAPMRSQPELHTPVLDGRDARVFPGITLSLVSDGAVLVPLERGSMVRETAPGAVASYWRVIPQFGRVWQEAADRNRAFTEAFVEGPRDLRFLSVSNRIVVVPKSRWAARRPMAVS